jgi:hypothetical protein
MAMTTKSVMGYLEAVLDFDNRYFRLAEDCIGAEIQFEFNGQQYIICLPNFDFEKLDGFGHPQPTTRDTKIGLNWLETKRVEGDNYGSEYYHNPKTKTVLKFSCNRLIIRSKFPITAAQARKAKKELPAWKQLFGDWLEASEYTDLEDDGVKVEQTDNIQAYYLPTAKPKTSRRIKSKDQPVSSITVSMHNGFTAPSLDKALQLTSTGQTPPGYYQQIVSALKYFHKKEYRQCVLDAATAFEMALIQMLDTRLSHLSSDEKKLIEDKYRQIVGLSDGLRKLGCEVPSDADIRQKLAEPRNSAIHKGKIVSKNEAQEALQFAKDFIYSNFPL